MQRREFLTTAGMAIGATTIAAPSMLNAATADKTPAVGTADWQGLRDNFSLTHKYVHLATFLLTSHPAPVSCEIERHRRAFDENPADYYRQHYRTIDVQIAQSAANYMGGRCNLGTFKYWRKIAYQGSC